MTPRRTRSTTAAVTALVLMLAGCGDDGDSAASPTSATASEATSGPISTTVPTTTPARESIAPETTVAPETSPPTTEASLLVDAVELLSSLQFVGTDYGPDYSIHADVDDLASPGGMLIQEAVQATPECDAVTIDAPLPYTDMSSGARIEFISSIGATNSTTLVVMPTSDAAAAYLEAIRSDPQFPVCNGLATLKTLSGAPEGITMEMVDFRLEGPLPGFGDDQAFVAEDLVIYQDGVELLTVVGGARYSRVDNVIIVVGGVSPDADAFASLVYERSAAALASLA